MEYRRVPCAGVPDICPTDLNEVAGVVTARTTGYRLNTVHNHGALWQLTSSYCSRNEMEQLIVVLPAIHAFKLSYSFFFTISKRLEVFFNKASLLTRDFNFEFKFDSGSFLDFSFESVYSVDSTPAGTNLCLFAVKFLLHTVTPPPLNN